MRECPCVGVVHGSKVKKSRCVLCRDGTSGLIKGFAFFVGMKAEESRKGTSSSKGENESEKKSCSCPSNVFCACSLC